MSRKVFVDTHYWIAMYNPGDKYHEIAGAAGQSLGATTLVTTDEVLIEFLNAFSGYGHDLRTAAAKIVRSLLNSHEVRVIAQSRTTLSEGLSRYTKRPDKEYSMVDCISMNTMEAEGIREVLTNDHHFEQEGFTILLK